MQKKCFAENLNLYDVLLKDKLIMTKIYTYILDYIFIFTSASFADKNMMIGSKGKINEVNRTIKVKMYDNYYEPKSFNIKKR